MKSDAYKRILIIRLSSLGDILLTTPMIRGLRHKYISAVIDFCIREEYRDIIDCNPHINSILSYTKDDSGVDILKKKIEQGNYDLIIDLQNNMRTATLLRGIKTKILYFNKKSLQKFLLVNFKLPLMKGLPSIPVRYAQTLPGLTLDEEGLELHYPASVVSDLPDTGNLIGFCPGSRHYTKMWPHEYFADLGEILTLHGYKIVLLGGK
ncbi:MAG: glycosyltransferase family 9 protein [Ignavibacteriales bacterium]|nr:glycosyltransferase family 9 protein [Ignavibacteriales bacterium]